MPMKSEVLYRANFPLSSYLALHPARSGDLSESNIDFPMNILGRVAWRKCLGKRRVCCPQNMHLRFFSPENREILPSKSVYVPIDRS